MAEGAADRTERATPKRREEARRKGQVLLSPEVSPVVVLVTALGVASAGLAQLVERSRVVVRGWLAAVGPSAGSDILAATAPLLGGALHQVGGLLVPFFLLVGVVGTSAVVAQVGWSVNPELVLPDVNRLSPMSGLRRVFSVTGAMNLIKSVVKIVLVLTVAYQVLRHVGQEAVATPALTPEEILSFTGASLRRLFLAMVLALAVLAALDYVWQRWRFEQSLRMTRQEVKDEHKELEGDPQVKARFRRAQREVAKRRMLAEVRRADVVLTNPVHVAVALRYRATEMGAPRVVAKGAGELAAKIKEAARSAGVPIVERRALARALYRSVALGAEIPPALYRAVAEILAYVYAVRRAPAEAGG
jgi:flagellar biosynthetic protein FlhB